MSSKVPIAVGKIVFVLVDVNVLDRSIKGLIFSNNNVVLRYSKRIDKR